MQKESGLLLREMPIEIRKYLLKIQGQIKVDKGISQYSLQNVVYKVIQKQIELEREVKQAS